MEDRFSSKKMQSIIELCVQVWTCGSWRRPCQCGLQQRNATNPGKTQWGEPLQVAAHQKVTLRTSRRPAIMQIAAGKVQNPATHRNRQNPGTKAGEIDRAHSRENTIFILNLQKIEYKNSWTLGQHKWGNANFLQQCSKKELGRSRDNAICNGKAANACKTRQGAPTNIAILLQFRAIDAHDPTKRLRGQQPNHDFITVSRDRHVRSYEKVAPLTAKYKMSMDATQNVDFTTVSRDRRVRSYERVPFSQAFSGPQLNSVSRLSKQVKKVC